MGQFINVSPDVSLSSAASLAHPLAPRGLHVDFPSRSRTFNTNLLFSLSPPTPRKTILLFLSRPRLFFCFLLPFLLPFALFFPLFLPIFFPLFFIFSSFSFCFVLVVLVVVSRQQREGESEREIDREREREVGYTCHPGITEMF